MRNAILVATAALPLATVLAWPAVAGAASCREELQEFERRLYDSALAAEDPEEYAELERELEDISELRDEARCAERLAELDARLPEPGAIELQDADIVD